MAVTENPATAIAEIEQIIMLRFAKADAERLELMRTVKALGDRVRELEERDRQRTDFAASVGALFGAVAREAEDFTDSR